MNRASKYIILVFLCSLFSIAGFGQGCLYSNLSDLYAGTCQQVEDIHIDKRSRIQVASTMGADYKVSVPSHKKLNKYIKKKCYAVQQDTSLYVNCKRLKYKKFRFGYGYAPAYWIEGILYFKAIPLGSMTANTTTSMNIKLGGKVGDAFAASGLISERVFYSINPETGKAEFVGKEKVWHLLDGYRDLQDKLLGEENESADVLEPYLLVVKGL